MGCDNGKGTQSSHEDRGSIAPLTLSPAKARMSKGLEALVLWLCPCCLLGPADPMDVQQQPLLRALWEEGSSGAGNTWQCWK